MNADYKRALPAVLPDGTPTEQAQWLISKRFVQTSRKYHHLARLPEDAEGPCGLLADTELSHVEFDRLNKNSQEYWKKYYPDWANALGPIHAAKQWMACHARNFDGCHIVVNQEVFDEYRKLGGDSWPWWL